MKSKTAKLKAQKRPKEAYVALVERDFDEWLEQKAGNGSPKNSLRKKKITRMSHAFYYIVILQYSYGTYKNKLVHRITK